MVGYLYPPDRNPERIIKADKDFAKKLDFKNRKFPVKTRNIHKIEKRTLLALGFLVMNKVKYPIYVSKKCCEDKHVDLLLTGEGETKHHVLIKDFNTSMYDHTLHRERRHFCDYCFQAFRAVEKLKCHIKDCFQIYGKQSIKIPKKGDYIKFKIFGRTIKSLFMIYADFESILVPENNGKQNPNESCTSKYQKHVPCSYGYKLVCADDKFSNSFKSYLGEDAVYNFISSVIEEKKYCSDVMEK